jgi:hypothetical protein
VVFGGCRAVVDRVRARVGRRVERRLGVREVSAADELADQRLVAGVAHVGRVVDAGIEDADNDALTGVAEILPHRREHACAHAALAVARAQRPRRVVVECIHGLPGLDARDAAEAGQRLDLGEARARPQVLNEARPPQELRPRRLERGHVGVGRHVVEADVDAVGQRRDLGVHEEQEPAREVVADVRGGEAMGVDGLDAVIDAILVLVPQPGCGERRGRAERQRCDEQWYGSDGYPHW